MDYLRQRRIAGVFLFFFLVFMSLMAHLANIQVIQGRDYAVKALNQQTQRVSLERIDGESSLAEVERGSILDRNLTPLTDPGYYYRLSVFPELIKNKGEAARQIGAVLGVEPAKIIPYLNGKPTLLPLAFPGEKLKETKELNLPGVQVVPVYFRYGPRALARHVIGNLGKISASARLKVLNAGGNKAYHFNDLEGKQGLEALFEKELKGTEAEKSITAFVDAGQHLIPGLGYKIETKGEDPGRQHLVLTIDSRIQQLTEKIMDENIREGAVVVMEANSGDIVALASRPNYDQNAVSKYLPRKDKALLDHTTLLYQPGSVYKLIVAAAALEEKVVSPDDFFICRGKEDIIPCDSNTPHGRITFAKAMAISCNPTFARVGLKLGAQKLIEYTRRFGLDNQKIIGYNLRNDQREDLSKLRLPNTLVNSSIGQGDVLATPVQITAMMNVAASGGYYFQPRLVKELRTSVGKVTNSFASSAGNRVISQETANTLNQLLAKVTTEGTGKSGFVPQFGSAGKTGTAQVNKSKDISNAWFSGYAPLEEPQYVITVLVEEGKSGGQTAAPVFKSLMEKILDRPDLP